MSDPILSNVFLERSALKFIAKGGVSAKYLLAKLDDSYFRNKTNSFVFQRIKTQLTRTQEIPSWRALLHDPSFPDGVKRNLSQYTEPVEEISRKAADEIYNQLYTYRTRRSIDKLSRLANEGLIQNQQTEALLDQLSTELVQARSKKERTRPLALGKGAHYKERLEKLLSGEAIPVWPTGLRDFDERGGGIAVGSLVLIGGPTNFGKTNLFYTINTNFADYGLRVGEISLEMDEDEVLLRRTAAICNYDQNKVLMNKVTEKEKLHIRQTMAQKVSQWAKKGSGVYTHCPKTGVTMAQALTEVEAYDYHVVGIDYTGLLDGMGGKDSWQQMGEACRLGKLDANRRKGVTIMLIQTSEEDKAKLSSFMMMHADYAFFIKYSADYINEDYAEIIMPKARKIKAAPFFLGKDFVYGRFTNYDGEPPEKDSKPGRKVTTDREKPVRVQGGQGARKPAQVELSEIDEELNNYFAGKEDF